MPCQLTQALINLLFLKLFIRYRRGKITSVFADNFQEIVSFLSESDKDCQFSRLFDVELLDAITQLSKGEAKQLRGGGFVKACLL